MPSKALLSPVSQFVFSGRATKTKAESGLAVSRSPPSSKATRCPPQTGPPLRLVDPLHGLDLHLAPLEDVDAGAALEVRVEGLVGRGLEHQRVVALGPRRAQGVGGQAVAGVEAHEAGEAGALHQ